MNKFLLLLFSGIFIHPALQAQDLKSDTSRKTSIFNYPKTSPRNKIYLYSAGIRVFKSTQLPKILKQTNASDFNDSYLDALMFKFNDNQISYRITGSYYKDNIRFANECSDCEITSGKLTDFAFKAGFEKNINYSVIQPYIGTDIGFRKNRFTGSSESLLTAQTVTPYDVTAEKNSLIFAPLFGVKLNVADHITIAAESCVNIQFNYERQEKVYQDASRTRTFNNDKNWEFLLRPVAFTLIYNFSQTD